MKSLIPLLFVFFGFPAFTQTSVYHPFPTDYGNWVYRYFGDFGEPSDFYTEYILNGDTTISDVDYKKFFVNSSYAGAIRELNKVVYFVPDTSLSEYKLYDFNLTLGDTIIHPFGGASCANDTIIIEMVDSVLASDGYHKRLFLSSFATWIEGIGNVYYLLQPAENLCVSGNDFLQCMMSDSTFIFPSSSNSCFLSVEDLAIPESDIFIYPNPSNGAFTIELKNGLIEEVLITDITGKEIRHKSKIQLNSYSVNNLLSGSYILKITDNQGRQVIKRVISAGQ
jgi:hypothetical protein